MLCDSSHARINLWQVQAIPILVIGLLLVGCGEIPVPDEVPVVTALPGGKVRWKPWAQRDSAQVLDRPILLFLYTQRSFWCRDLVARCFDDPELARHIMRVTLPIWVDVDQRPDLFERFGMGGVPSLVFLTPDGKLITGSTYVDPDDLANLLRRVQILFDNPDRLDALEQQRAELNRRVLRQKRKHPRPRIKPSVVLLQRVRDSLNAVVERGEDSGAEGLLALSEAGIDFWEHLRSARRDTDGVYVLAALANEGPIIDPEKHLGVNAGLLLAFAYVNASQNTAEAVLRRFAISGDVLLGAGLAGFRNEVGQALRDPAIYSGWNALMVSGLCTVYSETGQARFAEAGRRIFEALKTRFVRKDGLFVHGEKQTALVFLDDQALMIRAALDLFEAQGQRADLLFAQKLADQMLVVFADSSGALKDRTPESGMAVMPVVDRWLPSGNGVAAQVFVRLYRHTREQKYRDAATGILTALIGPHIDRIGYAGALNRALALFIEESKN